MFSPKTKWQWRNHPEHIGLECRWEDYPGKEPDIWWAQMQYRQVPIEEQKDVQSKQMATSSRE